MPEVDYEKMVKDQAAIIATLQDQIAKIQAALPVQPEPAVKPGGEYPRLLYRKSEQAGQLDVPGNEFKLVGDEAACKAALADGWLKEPVLEKKKK